MTDEQIIKALECYADNETHCTNCGYKGEWSCRKAMAKDALNLIKRQKAEIEQWKAEANSYQKMWCESYKDSQAEIERLRNRDEELLLKNYSFDKYYDEHIKRAKAKAIKEFADEIKRFISLRAIRKSDTP